jgi:hypothetical protein
VTHSFSVEPADETAHCYPLDTVLMASTVARAYEVLNAAHPLPRSDDVASLTGLLAGHLPLLLEETRPVIDAMYHGSTEWDRKKAAHDAARAAVESGPTGGLSAATSQLRALAAGCEQLLAVLADASRSTGHPQSAGPRR